jgi:GTP cyclohydrolase IA
MRMSILNLYLRVGVEEMNKEKIEQLWKEILIEIGENPNREGLKDTPKRIANMYEEIFRGYDKKQIPKITTFDNGQDGIVYDEMIIDEGDFYSHCEHHLVPFFGKYWFAYIPSEKGKILGLSKVARIVDYFSAKMQIQERLVREIVEYIWNELSKEEIEPEGIEPKGMALIMEAEHLCKTMRGAKKKGLMKCSYMKGCFRDDAKTREEFLNLIK